METDKDLRIDETLVFIAGISGAGKTVTVNTLSDLGFHSVVNLPISLLDDFLTLARTRAQQHPPNRFSRLAILVDIDSEETLNTTLDAIRALREKGKAVHLLFLDSKTETVLRRYSETRRPHPIFNPNHHKTREEAIQDERDLLSRFKDIATHIVDTSQLTEHDLKRKIRAFAAEFNINVAKKIRVNFISFGFKFGAPGDCDIIIDVRFLPNPHFIEALRPLTGLDPKVSEYVLTAPAAQDFVNRYTDLIQFLLPHYAFEGKAYLNIGIGCTGGKHRSVAIAEALKARVIGDDYLISINHRDAKRV